jgi:hypothetical protein
MATTIKSTALDFNAIKNNLKTFFQTKDEFKDYNYEASGLANLLDVLAYNTHYNALVANFALNESYLSTAQLRSSVVSLAEGLGYIPKTKTSSRATVQLSINTGNLAGRPAVVTLPTGTTFTTTVNDTVYTFQTREVVIGTDDGSGYYEFKSLSGSTNILIFEGKAKTKSFFVGEDAANTIYIIPDVNLDAESVVCTVYESATDTSYTIYDNIINATFIDENTTLYILKESPNEYYELAFGDGNTLGKTPVAGNKIVVSYLAVSGADANQAQVFRASNKVEIINGRSYNLNVVTISDSAGGSTKESIESIRKNAPFQYASQNRMVTSSDYSSLVVRNFPNLIKDIRAWGGEDALKPKYGTIYMSIVFQDNVTETQKVDIKNQVLDLAEQLSIISFDLEFEDPINTYVEVGVLFQFNPRLTTQSVNSIREQVLGTVSDYFINNTGKFERAFRRSNMLTLVDDIDNAVLSSRAEVKLQQRVIPFINNINEFALRYPAPIAAPDDENYIITSSAFRYSGRICNIRNRLGSSVLEVIVLSDLSVAVDNVGSYNASTGTVNIVGLRPDEIVGGYDYIKISVLPANQSAVAPKRNDILVYDADASYVRPIIVDAPY